MALVSLFHLLLALEHITIADGIEQTLDTVVHLVHLLFLGILELLVVDVGAQLFGPLLQIGHVLVLVKVEVLDAKVLLLGRLGRFGRQRRLELVQIGLVPVR